MAQPHRPKAPVDSLQAMINGILIEIGKALKASSKDGARPLGSPYTRLQSSIPGAEESFHQALDELECDILRAKSVLSRDLEELRTKRFALENPVPEEVPTDTADNGNGIEEGNLNGQAMMVENFDPSTQIESHSTIKEEKKPTSPEENKWFEQNNAEKMLQDPPKETVSANEETTKPIQAPSPPASANETSANSKPVGLGINTEAVSNNSAPGTAGAVESSVDSLFDVPDHDDNNVDINSEDMDFTFNSNTDTQTQTQDQSQLHDDFQLSTFTNNSQDLSNLQMSTDTKADDNTNNNNPNKQVDDLFFLDNAGDDSMNIDIDLDLVGAENSVFDDMFYVNGDEGLSGGGDMEHGTFDDDFFGLTN